MLELLVADLAQLRVPYRRVRHLHQVLPHLVQCIGLELVHEGLASVEGRDLGLDRLLGGGDGVEIALRFPIPQGGPHLRHPVGLFQLQLDTHLA